MMKASEQKILGIETEFDVGEFSNLTQEFITNRVSFMDYDFVIINAKNLVYGYTAVEETLNNKSILDADSSYQIEEDFRILKSQITDFLKCGRNVYVLIGENDSCYIQKYDDMYLGFGSFPKKPDAYTLFDVYSFLPLEISLTQIRGRTMNICCNPPYSDFFQDTAKYSYYAGYFNIKNASPLLKVPGSNYIVAASVKMYNGYLVFLPQPISDEEDVWGNEEKLIRKYLNALCKLNRDLSSSPTDFPDWAYDIQILNEDEVLSELQGMEQCLVGLQAKVDKQKKKLAKIQKYKALITESGAQLEKIVNEVLVDLGFRLKETVTGKADVIAEYKSRDIVAEIKGVSKSATETQAVQLEKWVLSFMEENKRKPKALLIVNGYCNKPLSQRPKNIFPNQMLDFSHTREHTLISTTQLLCLFIDIQNHPETKDEKICELLDTVGVYEKYPNVEEFLRPVKAEGL